MDIKDIVTGLTDVSTGDYYVRGIIYFVWQGKVVGTWDDCEHEQGRRDISSAFWSRFLGTEKIKGSAKS